MIGLRFALLVFLAASCASSSPVSPDPISSTVEPAQGEPLPSLFVPPVIAGSDHAFPCVDTAMFPAARGLRQQFVGPMPGPDLPIFPEAERLARRRIGLRFVLQETNRQTTYVDGELVPAGLHPSRVKQWQLRSVILTDKTLRFRSHEELIRAIAVSAPYDVRIRLKYHDPVYSPCKGPGPVSGGVEGHL